MKKFAKEYLVPFGSVFALFFGFPALVIWLTANTVEFVRTTGIDDVLSFTATVMPGPAETAHIRYTYDKLYPWRPSVRSPMGTARSTSFAGAYLKIYPLRLPDGSYAGLAVREGTEVHEGMKIRADFGRIYYPDKDTSYYAFWVEGQPEDESVVRFRRIHSCYANPDENEHLLNCPDWGKKG